MSQARCSRVTFLGQTQLKSQLKLHPIPRSSLPSSSSLLAHFAQFSGLPLRLGQALGWCRSSWLCWPELSWPRSSITQCFADLMIPLFFFSTSGLNPGPSHHRAPLCGLHVWHTGSRTQVFSLLLKQPSLFRSIIGRSGSQQPFLTLQIFPTWGSLGFGMNHV